jgi:hypothetical protein
MSVPPTGCRRELDRVDAVQSASGTMSYRPKGSSSSEIEGQPCVVHPYALPAVMLFFSQQLKLHQLS